MAWDAPFDEPVPLPNGRSLRTLRDGGEYVLKLPDRLRNDARWQNAAQALTLVAEQNGPVMFARMAFMHALHEDKPPAAPSERKDMPWGRRPLKRDK